MPNAIQNNDFTITEPVWEPEERLGNLEMGQHNPSLSSYFHHQMYWINFACANASNMRDIQRIKSQCTGGSWWSYLGYSQSLQVLSDLRQFPGQALYVLDIEVAVSW